MLNPCADWPTTLVRTNLPAATVPVVHCVDSVSKVATRLPAIHAHLRLQRTDRAQSRIPSSALIKASIAAPISGHTEPAPARPTSTAERM